MIVAWYVKWLLLIVVLLWFGFFFTPKYILKVHLKARNIVRGEEKCLSRDWAYAAN